MVQFLALALTQPLEVFHQFCRLDNQRHGKVLRRMKLLPIALLRKLIDRARQGFDEGVVHKSAWGG